MGGSRWSKKSAKEAYGDQSDAPEIKAGEKVEEKARNVAEEYRDIIQKAREEVQKKKDEEERKKKNRSPESVRAHINALRERLDKGFYGHLVQSDFKRTSIISTSGRVR